MSRLVVKNLPKKISEAKLRETFSGQGGEVTDVQLKYTKDGTFRHFGFVGFKTAEDAEKAKAYLDGAFIGASKVKVESCADLGDAKKPKSWSKYASDSSRNIDKVEKDEEIATSPKSKKKDKKEKQKKVDDLFAKYKDDPRFEEFLRVNKRNWTEKWDSDAILSVGKDFEATEVDKDKKEDIRSDDNDDNLATNKEVSDLDYLKSKKEKKKESEFKDYFTIKMSGLPYKLKKKDIKDFFKPLKPKSIRLPPKIKGIAYVGFADENEGKKALRKSKGFISDHQIILKQYNNMKDGKGQDGVTNEKWKAQAEGLAGEESVAESGRIFVRNLSYTVTEQDLEELFKEFGLLTEVNLPIDKATRKIKGFAFVTYMMPENAARAFEKLDGISFQGRLLHLLPGKAKPSDEIGNNSGESGTSSFKQKKAQKDKAQAGSSHNWNTLFLGASAVADVMADTYSVEKSQVLDTQGKQSAAVRLALGETQIVNQTREFLEAQGISLDAFSRPPTARSNCIILVKNLPARTSVEDLRDRFAVHGELGRLVMPPFGITAIVEFQEPTEARKAFKSLAYTKFGNTPLYLEWAPKDAFSTAFDKSKVPATTVHQNANSTLFVKNLNFDTTEDDLRDHFSSAGKIANVTISRKKDANRPGEMLSMGYGFVQFETNSGANQALKELQQKYLDGHALELKRSNRNLSAEVTSSAKRETVATDNDSNSQKKEAASKILVRNIPFEANTREVEDIFKTFGVLKSVRIPKKVTGSHRGFAFVEFSTKEDAGRAFSSLCHSTHLYGRRLVLEWAEQEATIDELRQKTAAKYSSGQPPSKRLKKSKIIESLTLGPT